MAYSCSILLDPGQLSATCEATPDEGAIAISAFGRELATRPAAIRYRLGLNDLPGASAQAAALEQSASAIGAVLLASQAQRLQQALLPHSPGGGALLNDRIRALDRAVAATLMALVHPRDGAAATRHSISSPTHWHTPIRSL